MAQLKPTLASLLTRTRRYLNEVDADKSYWSDDFLKELLNAEYRLRCAELHMAYEGFFVNVAQRDLTEDQTRYAWPPNFQRLHKMEVVRTDGRRRPVMRFERHEEVVQPPLAGGDSYHPTYRPVGSGFELEPGPSTTVTNGLRMEYYGVPAELEEDNDVLHSDFPDLFSEILVIDAALAAMNTEQFMDDGQGLQRTLEYERNRFERRWERYIDGRMASSRDQVTPFIAGYRDG